MRLSLFRPFLSSLAAAGLAILTACSSEGGGTPPVPAPSNLVYSANPATYTKGTAIPANTPTSGGGPVSSFTVAPALPAGLSLSAASGAITGTPTALAPASTYVITATNPSGSATANLSIAVLDAAPSHLSYLVNPAVYTVGLGIVPNTPTSQGGAVVSYAVTPALPAGLGLNSSSGAISGTPTAVSGAANFTISATNTGGTATAILNLAVDRPPLSITLQPVPQSVHPGQAATFTVGASGTGTLGYQWMKNGTEIPGAVSSSYTTGVTSPADHGARFSARVSDAFGGSALSNSAALTVLVTDVYVAGYQENPAGTGVATVWKNGVAQSLTDGVRFAEVMALAVSGSDVYAGGYEENAAGKMVAKIWKNGVAMALTDGARNANVKSLAISGADVYAAGYEASPSGKSFARIWKNGIATALTDGTQYAAANGIALSGADVLATGYEVEPSGKYVAKSWKNSVATSLADGTQNSVAESVAVSGSDVYICGYLNDAMGRSGATVWKNGIPTTFSEGGTTRSLALSGADVHVAGTTNWNAMVLWKNGVATLLTNGSPWAEGNGVAVSGNDVYAVGEVMDSAGNWIGKLWKNGAVTTLLSAGAISSGASCVLVNVH